MSRNITYQVEAFSDIIREALPVIRRHHEEVSLYQDRIPFDPDFDRYYMLERHNLFTIVTARANGVLIGYISQQMYPGAHFKQTLWSSNDGIWLAPEYREGWVGIKLITEMEKHLRARGVKMFEIQPKLHFQQEKGGLQKVLKFLGFEKTADVMLKTLGD